MNKNIKTLLNVLPIILVPLFTERNRIKEHPEMEKLGSFSSTAYHNVKDKGEGAYKSVKDTSSTIYHTGKSAAGTVGSKISDKRQALAYNKDIKSYQQSVKKEEKLLAQFKKDKEKHRRKRLQQNLTKDTVVPKIMQSNQGMSNEDKISGMTVTPELISEGPAIDSRTGSALVTNRENQDIALMYDEDRPPSRASLSEKDEKRLNIHKQEKQDEKHDKMEIDGTDQLNDEENDMTTDVQQQYFEKVDDHEANISDFDPGELFKKHHEKLDPTVSYDRKGPKGATGTAISQDSLFGQHRAAAEDHYTTHGRKTGIKNSMTKNKKQKKLENKINKKRQKF
ncbi:hypothetical protein [Lacicoccus alkaliphilus]|uniref:Uncharacterized protein n=1 Tax=Lacicoccus alkaliphilus DSM 16010 TaxID=1123231 RepID=A0A1M7F2P3_9BACL|nr:hypothetical protein [Salinicoccus alkaliphilus]SHL98305.1 hypothetical protein SAMN02745189_01313 [Salinicoccus alkaliphilus DSM 16010]